MKAYIRIWWKTLRKDIQGLIDELEWEYFYYDGSDSEVSKSDPGWARAVVTSTGKVELTKRGRRAFEAIVRIGTPSLDLLIKLLKSKDVLVKEVAAEALGGIEDNKAVPALIEALSNERSERLKSAIIESLGEIGDPTAIDAIIRAFKRRTTLWHVGASALANIDEARCIRTMVESLDAKYPARVHAAQTLAYLTDEDFELDYDKWKKWWKENKESFS